MSNGFRTGQMVLARNCECEEWFPFLYACLEEENGEYTHYMFDGMGYKMCIPLEGNEPLMFHNGPSLDQIDLPKKKKPKLKDFKYLEPVEIRNEDGYWEPANYIGCDHSHYENYNEDYENDAYNNLNVHKVIVKREEDVSFDYVTDSNIRKCEDCENE